MDNTTDDLRVLSASGLFGLDYGPSYCAVCGEWPASMTPRGKRCHLCWTRDIAAENPVPLPNGKQCLKDLASIGVPGAAERLAALWPNSKLNKPSSHKSSTDSET